jgi:gas vesicle protein
VNYPATKKLKAIFGVILSLPSNKIGVKDRDQKMSKTSPGSFMSGVLLGTALGAITGLLVAPRTGKETRQLLKKSADALPELAEDVSTSVQIQADRLSESALRKWDQTLGRLQEAIAAGVDATKIERQTLKHTKPEVPAESRPSVSDYKL